MNPTFTIGQRSLCSLDPISPPGWIDSSLDENHRSLDESLKRVIAEGDRDSHRRKYLNYCQALLSNHTKYEALSKLFPKYTWSDAMIYVRSNRSTSARIWWRDDPNPSISDTRNRLRDYLVTHPKLALSVVSPGHVTMVWIDRRQRTIEHYDPVGPCSCEINRNLDRCFTALWQRLLPDYTYDGIYSLPIELSVQTMRYESRRHLGIRSNDWFCQDYCLLYARYRMQGFDHRTAARKLVDLIEMIPSRILELNRLLIHSVRNWPVDDLRTNF